jgi:hypothetical protein
MSPPSASAPVKETTSASVPTTTPQKSLIASRRVLTFDNAGFRQRRLGCRRLGHCLGSGSGLLGGRRVFFRHC